MGCFFLPSSSRRGREMDLGGGDDLEKEGALEARLERGGYQRVHLAGFNLDLQVDKALAVRARVPRPAAGRAQGHPDRVLLGCKQLDAHGDLLQVALALHARGGAGGGGGATDSNGQHNNTTACSAHDVVVGPRARSASRAIGGGAHVRV